MKLDLDLRGNNAKNELFSVCKTNMLSFILSFGDRLNNTEQLVANLLDGIRLKNRRRHVVLMPLQRRAFKFLVELRLHHFRVCYLHRHNAHSLKLESEGAATLWQVVQVHIVFGEKQKLNRLCID